MFEISRIKETKSARGRELWKFSVRFILLGNIESIMVHNWAYDASENKLYRPSLTGTYAKVVVISDELAEQIRERIRQFIVLSKGDFNLTAVVARAQSLLETATPEEAFNQLWAQTQGQTLTPGQQALLTALGVLTIIGPKRLAPNGGGGDE